MIGGEINRPFHGYDQSHVSGLGSVPLAEAYFNISQHHLSFPVRRTAEPSLCQQTYANLVSKPKPMNSMSPHIRPQRTTDVSGGMSWTAMITDTDGARLRRRNNLIYQCRWVQPFRFAEVPPPPSDKSRTP